MWPLLRAPIFFFLARVYLLRPRRDTSPVRRPLGRRDPRRSEGSLRAVREPTGCGLRTLCQALLRQSVCPRYISGTSIRDPFLDARPLRVQTQSSLRAASDNAPAALCASDAQPSEKLYSVKTADFPAMVIDSFSSDNRRSRHRARSSEHSRSDTVGMVGAVTFAVEEDKSVNPSRVAPLGLQRQSAEAHLVSGLFKQLRGLGLLRHM